MISETTRHLDFDKVIPEYGSRFPMEMAVLRLGGVYPGEHKEGAVNPYTHEVDTEYFGNIGEHCIAVAFAAEVIVNATLGENNPLTKTITSRALVHDSTKRFEIMRRKALRAGIMDDAYSLKSYETIKPILQKENISPDLIEYMATAGSETGHISFPKFLKLEDGNPVLDTTDNIADLIVHLADDMTFTPIVSAGEVAQTSYLTSAERMKASNFPNRYPFLYVEGLGFDKSGNIILVKDATKPHPELEHVKVYAEWQKWISSEIAKYLVSQIDPRIPADQAEQYLKNLVSSAL